MNNKADHRHSHTQTYNMQYNWFSPAYACTNLYNNTVLHSTAHSTIGSTIVVVSFYMFAPVCSFITLYHKINREQNTQEKQHSTQAHQSTTAVFFLQEPKWSTIIAEQVLVFFGARFQTHRTEYDSWSVWIEKCVQVCMHVRVWVFSSFHWVEQE